MLKLVTALVVTGTMALAATDVSARCCGSKSSCCPSQACCAPAPAPSCCAPRATCCGPVATSCAPGGPPPQGIAPATDAPPVPEPAPAPGAQTYRSYSFDPVPEAAPPATAPVYVSPAPVYYRYERPFSSSNLNRADRKIRGI